MQELTFDQVKELIAYGSDLGLQQLQTQGLVVVYGTRPTPLQPEAPTVDDAESITAMYAALGKGQLRK